jgi:hypothetical protein
MPSSRPGVAGALASTAGVVLLLPAVAFAASPSPTAAAGGDPRSSGQGPGLVGDPLWAMAIVAVIAVLSILATVAYVRATHGSGNGPDR